MDFTSRVNLLVARGDTLEQDHDIVCVSAKSMEDAAVKITNLINKAITHHWLDESYGGAVILDPARPIQYIKVV